METDREQAARSMMQAGIGSLSGRPSRPHANGQVQGYETVGDQMRGEGFLETVSGKKIFPTQMNDWGINQQYQRLGKDNMMAPWASHLRTDDYYDNTKGYTENLNDLMRDVGSDIWGGVKEKIGGVGDTISDFLKYGWGDPESRWEGSPYELDEFEFNLLNEGTVDFEGVLPGERTIDREGEEYQRLQELKKQLRNQWQLRNRGGIIGLL
jgi:hypothetical protein